jgi:hypothetical protein
MKSLLAIVSVLALTGIACEPRAYNDAGVKDVAAYGDDFNTKVPVEDIYIAPTVAKALIENIKFDKVNQGPTNTTRYFLKLSNDALLSCHSKNGPAADPRAWSQGCTIALFADDSKTNTKSVPCDDACQKNSLMFGGSALGGIDGFQKVSMVGFDKADAEVLLRAMKVPTTTIISGIPGFFNNIPGKMVSNIPSVINESTEFPDQMFSLMCGSKTDAGAVETRCMLFVFAGK